MFNLAWTSEIFYEAYTKVEGISRVQIFFLLCSHCIHWQHLKLLWWCHYLRVTIVWGYTALVITCCRCTCGCSNLVIVTLVSCEQRKKLGGTIIEKQSQKREEVVVDGWFVSSFLMVVSVSFFWLWPQLFLIIIYFYYLFIINLFIIIFIWIWTLF